MEIKFPNAYIIDEKRASNPIRQVGELGLKRQGTIAPFSTGKLRGQVFYPEDGGERVLIVPRATPGLAGSDRIVCGSLTTSAENADLSNGIWVRHPMIDGSLSSGDRNAEIESVRESWQGGFTFLSEYPDQAVVGLRRPQLGALHAVHAHWSVSDTPATIVMPTGTGKTDTMIAVLVSTRCPRLLIVVPTDALRAQMAEKFMALGIIGGPGCDVLWTRALYPIVCSLHHVPRTPDEVDDVFGSSHIVITTSAAAGQSSPAVQERMAQLCSHLFIDEAHHVEAPTWRAFKDRFKNRRILQFTATPFREDGRPIDGEIIFKYSMAQAQREGYFATIAFRPVNEFNTKRSDEAIAIAAIRQLEEDYDKGHILMARVDSVARAYKVFAIYNKHPKYKPVQLHTGIKSRRERDAARRLIISGESRVVVCVDMLGEGFDLPELKIAAFHDIRKTLAVTLQLAGRFTRGRPDLGNATFIANTADINVQDELRKLYTMDPAARNGTGCRTGSAAPRCTPAR